MGWGNVASRGSFHILAPGWGERERKAEQLNKIENHFGKNKCHLLALLTFTCFSFFNVLLTKRVKAALGATCHRRPAEPRSDFSPSGKTSRDETCER